MLNANSKLKTKKVQENRTLKTKPGEIILKQ